MIVDQVIGIAVAAMVSIAIILVRVLIDEIERQKKQYPPQPQRKHSTSTFNGKLLRQRVAQLRIDYPDRAENWYWQKAQRDYELSRTQAPPVNLTHPITASSSNPLDLSQKPLRVVQTVDSHTQRKLFALVNGNRKVATRLLETVRYNNSNRSEQWCWEKVIYDLERDRRA